MPDASPGYQLQLPHERAEVKGRQKFVFNEPPLHYSVIRLTDIYFKLSFQTACSILSCFSNEQIYVNETTKKGLDTHFCCDEAEQQKHIYRNFKLYLLV